MDLRVEFDVLGSEAARESISSRTVPCGIVLTLLRSCSVSARRFPTSSSSSPRVAVSTFSAPPGGVVIVETFPSRVAGFERSGESQEKMHFSKLVKNAFDNER